MGVVLVNLAVVSVLLAGVVALVRRMLRRHRPTEDDLRRAVLTEPEFNGAQLPTLTTETTGKVTRDPGFDLEAQTVRQRGMGW